MVDCSIGACGRSAVTRSWCRLHYKRWLRYGDPAHPVNERNQGVLTKRETQVLAMAARGWTANETGEFLGISPKTVKTFRQSINHKLETHNVAHAVAIGLTEGLITLTDEH